MGYFRAISQRDERSERALILTERIIEYNPAHYTIWLVASLTRSFKTIILFDLYFRHYRQQILFSLNKNLYEELDFVKDQIDNNPKNYQLW